MKKSLVVILILFIKVSLSAQINLGVDYYRLGENQKARPYFEKELTTNPETANFYLGEIAFAEGDTRKAESYYNSGLSANPESIINQIGLAKLKLKSETKAAEAVFSSISKRNKKNVNVAISIGRAYLDNGMFRNANSQVSAAKRINNKIPEIYILEGDIIVAEDDVKKLGEAASKYEMSVYFDAEYGLGYVKGSNVYEYINSTLAIDKLKTIIEKQPDYIIAYSYLGKLYTNNGFYPQAIDMYGRYFKSASPSIEDTERYARALYFSNIFEEAKVLVDKGLQKDPNHFVLNRYLMYINSKLNNFEEGKKAADKFFTLRDASGYIAQDHTAYGSLLKIPRLFDEAIAQYERAIELEPEKFEHYAEAAGIARSKRDYALAASYVNRMMVKKAELADEPEFYNDDVIDINALGYDYYSAGATIASARSAEIAQELMNNRNVTNELLAANSSLIRDSLTNNLSYFTRNYALHFLNKADSVFDILLEIIPDSYSTYRFKALTKHAINTSPEVGLAKPYYEKVVELIVDREDINPSAKRTLLLEAYVYLGYHYYMISDKPNTVLYMDKVLEIDPEHANAKAILADVNQ